MEKVNKTIGYIAENRGLCGNFLLNSNGELITSIKLKWIIF